MSKFKTLLTFIRLIHGTMNEKGTMLQESKYVREYYHVILSLNVRMCDAFMP